MKMTKILNYLITALFMAATGVCLSACGGDDKNLWEDTDKFEKQLYAYWGEQCVWLQGVWVEENDRDNANADYVVIERGSMGTQFRSRGMFRQMYNQHGLLVFTLGDIHRIRFDATDNYGRDCYMSWTDNTHTRLEVMQADRFSNKLYEETKSYWIKLDHIPGEQKGQ